MEMKHAKKLIVALLALSAAAALAACGDSDDSSTGTGGGESAVVSGEFVTLAEEPASDFQIIGEAELERTEGGTVLSLSASGLEPKTRYIAHLHTGGCDQADPGGPHFQFEKGGSEEPPNELHLKFVSNAAGEGEATTSSKQEVPPGEAGSVVLHVDDSHEMTSFGAGEAEAETIFVHEGVDHSQEGAGHEGGKAEPEHAHSDKIACAELEGAAASAGGSSDDGEVPTVEVRDGEPVGGVAELEFDAGEEIRFRVSSDEAEEIHVHGYDLAKDVPAGGTVEFAFPAELEGIYEAELEQQGVQIVELQINP
jgi:hypothetical protein